MKRSSVTPTGEDNLYRRIRELVVTARQTVARGIDLVQVRTNFEIGRHIVEHEQQGEQRAAYGKALLTTLAERLTQEFGQGFARSNIAYMRSFYLAYSTRASIVQTASGQLADRENVADIATFQIVQKTSGLSSRPFSLSWSHYVFLLGIKNPDERSFYEIEATSQNWTLRELKRQFDSGLYERLALSRDKEGIRKLAREGQIVSQPQDLLKEPLVLEFLGLSEQTRYSESELESALIDQLGQFLLELGKGFLFEARQKRFSFDDEHFFVDLVFYNRLLRCYVLIDLKLGKLTHQDLGQMQMYVNYFDRHVKTAAVNATGEIPRDYVLNEGDLLVAMTEQAAGLLGSPILVPESDKFLHNQRLGLVTKKSGATWTNEFFFHVFNTQTVRKEIYGSASGVKVRHTSPTKIGQVVVAFPTSTIEQKWIVATLASLADETQRLESLYQQKLTALDDLKKSLLHQAFSGQL